MSRLGDLLKKRKTDKSTVVADSQPIRKYHKIWLNKIADQYEFDINDAGGKVDGILEALNRKEGHCPCGGNGDQFLCPCVVMREKGICKCGLFVTHRPINPINTSTSAKVKEN